jgi:hypothetical protein
MSFKEFLALQPDTENIKFPPDLHVTFMSSDLARSIEISQHPLENGEGKISISKDSQQYYDF